MSSASDKLSWGALAKEVWSGLLDLLYPPYCVGCSRLGSWFCPECQATLLRLTPPLCDRCGLPLAAPGICATCQEQPHRVSAMRSVAYHSGPVRQAIHALKYEGATALAGPLGDLLVEYWRQFSLGVDLVVPVPLHASRIRQRGYNQAEVLAARLCEGAGLPLAVNVLARERNTPSQVGLSRDARRDNVAGAFVCRDDSLAGKRVLLVDDVLTTGATLESCAEALLTTGAAKVMALTLARAGGMRDLTASDLGDEQEEQRVGVPEDRG